MRDSGTDIGNSVNYMLTRIRYVNKDMEGTAIAIVNGKTCQFVEAPEKLHCGYRP
jgi:hypothetical protein